MARGTVYVETTVVSYVVARPSRDVIALAHQELTRQWWSRRDSFELYLSPVATSSRHANDCVCLNRILCSLPWRVSSRLPQSTFASCVFQNAQSVTRRTWRSLALTRWILVDLELRAHRQRGSPPEPCEAE